MERKKNHQRFVVEGLGVGSSQNQCNYCGFEMEGDKNLDDDDNDEIMFSDALRTDEFVQFDIGRDDDPDTKVQRSRERNREHAKRTRLRKKAVLEIMKDRLLELQNEV